MTSTVDENLVRLETAGAYLPSILLFYTYLINSSILYLGFGVASLLSAVIMHGAFRKVFGPGGPRENPLPSSEGRQRVLVLLVAAGPAKFFPDNNLDAALNSIAFREFISWRTAVRWVGIAFSWIGVAISPPLTLFLVFPHLQRASPTILVVYFALAIWFLQKFVVWRFFPDVYYVEENPSEAYDLDHGEDFQPVKPDRPADWMESADASILSILNQKEYPVTAALITFYWLRNRIDPDGWRDWLRLFNNWNSIQDSIETRLSDLEAHGLVDEFDPDLFHLTELGEAYMDGEVPASLLETRE